MSDVRHGGCLCGAVRYRLHGDPVVGTVCHCKFCQKRLGSAYAVLASYEMDAVEIEGEVKEIEHRSDVSGRWLRMQFCPACGTTVSHTSEWRPGKRAMTAGTLDDPSWLRIDRHIWTQSKLPWVVIPEGVESHPQGPGVPAK